MATQPDLSRVSDPTWWKHPKFPLQTSISTEVHWFLTTLPGPGKAVLFRPHYGLLLPIRGSCFYFQRKYCPHSWKIPGKMRIFEIGMIKIGIKPA